MECAVPNLLPITQRARDAGSNPALISARLDGAPTRRRPEKISHR